MIAICVTVLLSNNIFLSHYNTKHSLKKPPFLGRGYGRKTLNITEKGPGKLN